MKSINKILLTMMMALASLGAAAQSVNINITPRYNPMPPNLALYYEKMGEMFSVVVSNPEDSPLRLYFGLTLEQLTGEDGNLLYIQLPAQHRRPPMETCILSMSPSTTVNLNQMRLNDLFSWYAVSEFSGVDALLADANVLTGELGMLPEGTYKLTLIARNYDMSGDNNVVSDPSQATCTFTVCYRAEAPRITTLNPLVDPTVIEQQKNYPHYRSDVPEDTPVIDFTKPTNWGWTSSTLSCNATAQIQYALEFYKYQEPFTLDQLEANPFLKSYTTPYQFANSLMIDAQLSNVNFDPGYYYAVRVHAKPDIDRDVLDPRYFMIQNNGYGEWSLIRCASSSTFNEITEEIEHGEDWMATITHPKLTKPATNSEPFTVLARVTGNSLDLAWEASELLENDSESKFNAEWFKKLKLTYTVKIFKYTDLAEKDIDKITSGDPVYEKKGIEKTELSIPWEDLQNKVTTGSTYFVQVVPVLPEDYDAQIEEEAIIFTGSGRNCATISYYIEAAQKFEACNAGDFTNPVSVDLGQSITEKDKKTIYIGSADPDQCFELMITKASRTSTTADEITTKEKELKTAQEELAKATTDAAKKTAQEKIDKLTKEIADLKAKQGTDTGTKTYEYNGNGYVIWRPYGNSRQVQVNVDLKNIQVTSINGKNVVFKGTATSTKWEDDAKIPYSLISLGMEKATGLVTSETTATEVGSDTADGVKKILKLEDVQEAVEDYWNLIEGGGEMAQQIFHLCDGGAYSKPLTLPLCFANDDLMDESWAQYFNVSLMDMEFGPDRAQMGCLLMFKVPGASVSKSTKSSTGTDSIATTDVLALVAPRLCIRPNRLWAAEGEIGLLYDTSVKEGGDDGFVFTFKAPTNWESLIGENGGCGMHFDYDVDANKMKTWRFVLSADVSVPGLLNLAETAPPKIHAQCEIENWSDWLVEVDMEEFKHEDLPGYSFKPGRVLYDHSSQWNWSKGSEKVKNAMNVPDGYDWSKWGAGIKGQTVEWQGLYMDSVIVTFPQCIEIKQSASKSDDEVDENANSTTEVSTAEAEEEKEPIDTSKNLKFMIDNLLWDKTGLSCEASLNNIVSLSTGRLGGWKLSVDKLLMSIVQSDFKKGSLQGQIGVPLIGGLDYECAFNFVTQSEVANRSSQPSSWETGKRKFHMWFEINQPDSIQSVNLFLGDLNFNEYGTYLLVDYLSGADTQIEFMASGTVTIGGGSKSKGAASTKTPLGLSIPGVRFTGLRVANYNKKYSEAKEWADDYVDNFYSQMESQDQQRFNTIWGSKDAYATEVARTLSHTTNSSGKDDTLVGTDNSSNSLYFNIGKWSLASEEKKVWGDSFKIEDFDIKTKTKDPKVTTTEDVDPEEAIVSEAEETTGLEGLEGTEASADVTTTTEAATTAITTDATATTTTTAETDSNTAAEPEKKDLYKGLYVFGKVGLTNNNTGSGVTGKLGMTLWCKVGKEGDTFSDWSFNYSHCTVDTMMVNGKIGGLIEVEGRLGFANKKDTEGREGKGFAGGLKVDVMGLFKLDCQGGFYQVEKDSDEKKEDGETDSEATSTEATTTEEAAEEKKSTYKAGFLYADASGFTIPMGPVSLSGIQFGFYINYSLANADLTAYSSSKGIQSSSEGEGDNKTTSVSSSNSYDLATQLKNPILKYKSYGGCLGVTMSMGTKDLVSGNFLGCLFYDADKDQLSRLQLQGKVKALDGLLNAKCNVLYENTITGGDSPDERKAFELNLTVDVACDMAKEANKFLGNDDNLKAIAATVDKVNLTGMGQEKDSDNNSDTADTDAKSASSKEEKKKDSALKMTTGVNINMNLMFGYYPNGRTLSNGTVYKKKTNYWHVYIGEPDPDKRCRITFIDFDADIKVAKVKAKVYCDAYVCFGNELPGNGQLPALPTKVQEFLDGKSTSSKLKTSASYEKLNKVRSEVLAKGPGCLSDVNSKGGVQFGFCAGAEFSCEAVLAYATLEAILGLDVVLTAYDNCDCINGGTLGGKGGFYAMGQVYGYLHGTVGLMLNLGFWKGKFPLVDVAFGALLKGGCPHPSWAYGKVRVKGSVMGGLFSFNRSAELHVGRVCIPRVGSPLNDFDLFNDWTIGYEEEGEGWNDDVAISPLHASGSFQTNASINRDIGLFDEDKYNSTMGMSGSEEKDAAATQASTRYFRFYLGEWVKGAGRSKGTKAVTLMGETGEPIELSYGSRESDKDFAITMPALEELTDYTLTLRGYAKECEADGTKEGDPWNWDSAQQKDVREKYEDIKTLYFRTKKKSSDWGENTAIVIPSNGAASRYDLANPMLAFTSNRSDLLDDPDYEYYADLLVERPEIGEGFYGLADVSYDTNGNRLTTTRSQYERLRVRGDYYKGVDMTNPKYPNGFNYECYIVGLQTPLPESTFQRGMFYRYKFYRINKANRQAFLNRQRDTYKSMIGDLNGDLADVTGAVQEELAAYYDELEQEYGAQSMEMRLQTLSSSEYIVDGEFREDLYTLDATVNTVDTNLADKIARGGTTVRFRQTQSIPWGDGTKWVTDAGQLQMYPSELLTYSSPTMLNDPYLWLSYWQNKSIVLAQAEGGVELPKHRWHRYKVRPTCLGLRVKFSNKGKYFNKWRRNQNLNEFKRFTGATADQEFREEIDPMYTDKWLNFKQDYLFASQLPNALTYDLVAQYMADANLANEVTLTLRHDILQVLPSKYADNSDIDWIAGMDQEHTDEKCASFVTEWTDKTHSFYQNDARYKSLLYGGGKVFSDTLSMQMGITSHIYSADRYAYRIAQPENKLNKCRHLFDDYMLNDEWHQDNEGHTYFMRGAGGQYRESFDGEKFAANVKGMRFILRTPSAWNFSGQGDSLMIAPRRGGVDQCVMEVPVSWTYKANSTTTNYSTGQPTYTSEDYVYFQDEVFYKYIKNNLLAATGIQVGEDDQKRILRTQLKSVTDIDLVYQQNGTNVSDVSGIDMMPNLRSFRWSLPKGQKATGVDGLNRLSNLRKIRIEGYNLVIPSINICDMDSLEECILTNLSNATGTVLSMSPNDYVGLQGFRMGNNPMLKKLDLSGNHTITELDLSESPLLEDLDIQGCTVSELDLTVTPRLTRAAVGRQWKETKASNGLGQLVQFGVNKVKVNKTSQAYTYMENHGAGLYSTNDLSSYKSSDDCAHVQMETLAEDTGWANVHFNLMDDAMQCAIYEQFGKYDGPVFSGSGYTADTSDRLYKASNNYRGVKDSSLSDEEKAQAYLPIDTLNSTWDEYRETVRQYYQGKSTPSTLKEWKRWYTLDLDQLAAAEAISYTGRGIKNIDGLPRYMPNLKQIDLSGNLITEFNATPWLNLEKLDISSNRVVNFTPGTSTYRSLNVSNNLLAKLDLKSQSALESLWANENFLANLEHLSDCSKLSEIYLYGNRFEYIDLTPMSNTGSGVTIDLGGNALDITDENKMLLPTNVSELHIDKTLALKSSTLDLSGYSSLKSLYADGMQGVTTLVPPAAIKILSAPNSSVKKVATTAIARTGNTLSSFRSLSTFNMRGSQLSGTITANLGVGALTSLDVTDAAHTQVTISNYNSRLMRLAVGQPSANSGMAKKLCFTNVNAMARYDKEWRLLADNDGVVAFMSGEDPGDVEIEEISEEDRKMREVLGETVYLHLYKKYTPDKRYFTENDAGLITHLSIPNLQVALVDSTFMSYFFNAFSADLSGNNISMLEVPSRIFGVDVSGNSTLASLDFDPSRLQQANVSNTNLGATQIENLLNGYTAGSFYLYKLKRLKAEGMTNARFDSELTLKSTALTNLALSGASLPALRVDVLPDSLEISANDLTQIVIDVAGRRIYDVKRFAVTSQKPVTVYLPDGDTKNWFNTAQSRGNVALNAPEVNVVIDASRCPNSVAASTATTYNVDEEVSNVTLTESKFTGDSEYTLKSTNLKRLVVKAMPNTLDVAGAYLSEIRMDIPPSAYRKDHNQWRIESTVSVKVYVPSEEAQNMFKSKVTADFTPTFIIDASKCPNGFDDDEITINSPAPESYDLNSTELNTITFNALPSSLDLTAPNLSKMVMNFKKSEYDKVTTLNVNNRSVSRGTGSGEAIIYFPNQASIDLFKAKATVTGNFQYVISTAECPDGVEEAPVTTITVPARTTTLTVTESVGENVVIEGSGLTSVTISSLPKKLTIVAPKLTAMSVTATSAQINACESVTITTGKTLTIMVPTAAVKTAAGNKFTINASKISWVVTTSSSTGKSK
ncbi:MAG: hypothetical protein LIP02_03775 [Bacteroidales bacterium]|nr:hypothetical protein [Bacteroidales bacterium]